MPKVFISYTIRFGSWLSATLSCASRSTSCGCGANGSPPREANGWERKDRLVATLATIWMFVVVEKSPASVVNQIVYKPVFNSGNIESRPILIMCNQITNKAILVLKILWFVKCFFFSFQREPFVFLVINGEKQRKSHFV